MVPGEWTVDRYLKMTLERKIENVGLHVEKKWDMGLYFGNMAQERYLTMDVAVEMTLKYG